MPVPVNAPRWYLHSIALNQKAHEELQKAKDSTKKKSGFELGAEESPTEEPQSPQGDV